MSRDFYLNEGYIVRRSLFTEDEISTMSDEADRVLQREDLIHSNNLRCRWQDHFQTKECRFDCFDPITDLSEPIDRIARNPKLLDFLAELYGEPAYLFKDKLIYKPPGATGYGLHQDYISWDSFPKSFVTVLIPIDAATDENGATEIFPGTHRDGYLSPLDGDYHPLEESAVAGVAGVRLCLNPGDVAVFHGMLPHRSSANRSDQWRRQLYLSYNAQSDGGDQRDAHYREFQQWLQQKYAAYGKTETYFK